MEENSFSFSRNIGALCFSTQFLFSLTLLPRKEEHIAWNLANFLIQFEFTQLAPCKQR